MLEGLVKEFGQFDEKMLEIYPLSTQHDPTILQLFALELDIADDPFDINNRIYTGKTIFSKDWDEDVRQRAAYMYAGLFYRVAEYIMENRFPDEKLTITSVLQALTRSAEMQFKYQTKSDHHFENMSTSDPDLNQFRIILPDLINLGEKEFKQSVEFITKRLYETKDHMGLYSLGMVLLETGEFIEETKDVFKKARGLYTSSKTEEPITKNVDLYFRLDLGPEESYDIQRMGVPTEKPSHIELNDLIEVPSDVFDLPELIQYAVEKEQRYLVGNAYVIYQERDFKRMTEVKAGKSFDLSKIKNPMGIYLELEPLEKNKSTINVYYFLRHIDEKKMKDVLALEHKSKEVY